MKIRFLTTLGVVLLGLSALAQDFYDSDTVVFDTKEDSTNTTSIQDIINIRMQTDYNHEYAAHIKKVWKRKGFFDISYIKSTATATTPLAVATSPDNSTSELPANDTKFVSDWGLGIKWGKNFNLHKRAIGNILMFNLDYTWIDLSTAHYKSVAEKDIQHVPTTSTGSTYGTTAKKSYVPWELNKYALRYNMLLGPSITLAPFTPIKNFGLDHVKLNVYFHIGYGINVMMMPEEKYPGAPHFSKDTKNTFGVAFGHGLITAFGGSINWKAIGIGIETTTQNYQFTSSESYYNSDEKLKDSSTRIFLQLRL